MERLKSRKLWITVLGAIGVVLIKEFGVDQETVTSFTNIILVGLGSLGVVDTAKAIKK